MLSVIVLFAILFISSSKGRPYEGSSLFLKSIEKIDETLLNHSIYSSPYWDNAEEPPVPFDPKIFNASELHFENVCPEKRRPCNVDEEYRRTDEFCNNKKYPLLGASHQVLSRLIRPIYDNGIMRMFAVNGNLLPNPRIVSSSMKLMKRRQSHSDANILWLIFGQFIDHDFSVTPMSLEQSMGENLCHDCSSWKFTSVCAPILIPKTDEHISPFLSNKKRRCLPFVRSAVIPSKYGKEEPPAFEQLNDNTAFLDLSPVYGSDKCTEKRLRLYHYGQLLEVKHPLSSKGMLPLQFTPASKDCRSHSGKCPEAGDERSVETVLIHLFHLVFLREHNRLASALHFLNKHWSDEKLFQEARKINIAQYQKIIYDEFLPILLGKTLMKEYGLEISYSFYKGYDQEVNPNVLTEFATAAFRVGHTMVPDDVPLLDSSYFPKSSFSLKTLFRNATYLYKEHLFEDLARGMLSSKIEAVDPIIKSTLQDKLFIKNLNPFTSQDLISLNIARGRDHGIPGYTSYLSLCGSRAAKSWEDLKMYKEDLSILKNVYSSVHDVDLFVGGLAEFPLDGLVGPTFGCIIATQFMRAKTGDAFWFENEYNGFTISQLNSIRASSSLSKILVMNLNGLSLLPNETFKVPSKRNILSKSWLEDIDIALWKEEHKQEKSCYYKGRTFLPGNDVPASQCLKCLCNPLQGEISCTKNLDGCDEHNLSDIHCAILC